MQEHYKNLSLDDISGEEWRDIKDYEGLYQVSNMGRVKLFFYKNTSRKKILKPVFNNYGYLHIKLCKDKKEKTVAIHILVAKTFIPNPENKPTVNHIDENKTNNTVSNLNWMNYKEQNLWGTRLERSTKKNKRKRKVICKTTGEIFISVAEASKKYKLSDANICACCNGKRNYAGKLQDGTKLEWEYIDGKLIE